MHGCAQLTLDIACFPDAQKVLLAVVVLMAAASGVILGLDLFAFTEQ